MDGPNRVVRGLDPKQGVEVRRGDLIAAVAVAAAAWGAVRTRFAHVRARQGAARPGEAYATRGAGVRTSTSGR